MNDGALLECFFLYCVSQGNQGIYIPVAVVCGFPHLGVSTVFVIATLVDTIKFEMFLFVLHHSRLPRNVPTCCCYSWLSFTAVTVMYLPWLPWETLCKKKYSNLCRIIKGCQGMYIPVAVARGFHSLQGQYCTWLGYLGRQNTIWNVPICVESFNVAKGCTYLLLLHMVFLRCNESAVLALATLGDMM